MTELRKGAPVSAYDLPMATDDLVTELAARAYRRILEARHPGVVWMRLSAGEVERLWGPLPVPLAGDVDDRLVRPDDMHAAA